MATLARVTVLVGKRLRLGENQLEGLRECLCWVILCRDQAEMADGLRMEHGVAQPLIRETRGSPRHALLLGHL